MSLHFRYRHLNKPIWFQAELSITEPISKRVIKYLTDWVSKDKDQVSLPLLYDAN